jgi:tagatose-1,6-bisphosphate aldolase
MNGNGGELSSFLQKLSEDKELQQAYAKDPRGTMRQAGLSDDMIDATMSRDLGRIKSELSRELGAEAQVMMVLTDPNV